MAKSLLLSESQTIKASLAFKITIVNNVLTDPSEGNILIKICRMHNNFYYPQIRVCISISYTTFVLTDL